MFDKSPGLNPRNRILNVSRHQGFSLVEVMMSIVLIAIGLVLAMPSYTDMAEKRQLTNGAEQIASMLNSAQGAAMKSNNMITLKADRTNDSAWCIGVAEGDLICDCKEEIESTECILDGSPLFIDQSAAASLVMNSATSASNAYYIDPIRGLFLPCDPLVNLTCEKIELSDLPDLNAPLELDLRSRSGDFRLSLIVNHTGRVILCSPDANYAVPGYPRCPPLQIDPQFAEAD